MDTVLCIYVWSLDFVHFGGDRGGRKGNKPGIHFADSAHAEPSAGEPSVLPENELLQATADNEDLQPETVMDTLQTKAKTLC